MTSAIRVVPAILTASVSVIFPAILLVYCTLFAGTAAATPIYLKAGQCILVGTQEVCAMSADQAGNAAVTTNVLNVCRYGLHPGAEIPNLKSHALFQILTNPQGIKTETVVRQYGISDTDKEACQKEADRLNAGTPR